MTLSFWDAEEAAEPQSQDSTNAAAHQEHMFFGHCNAFDFGPQMVVKTCYGKRHAAVKLNIAGPADLLFLLFLSLQLVLRGLPRLNQTAAHRDPGADQLGGCQGGRVAEASHNRTVSNMSNMIDKAAATSDVAAQQQRALGYFG